MKKFLVWLLLLFSIGVTQAQSYMLTTSDYAYKIKENGYWSAWSDWLPCVINVYVDCDANKITIYSKVTQVYRIYDFEPQRVYSNGDTSTKFYVIDQDNDRGDIRIKNAIDGKQIYVDFANIIWVYNIQ